jgi:hypothetical protein
MSLKSSARATSVWPILSPFILVLLPLLSPPSPVLAWDPPVQASNKTRGYWNSPYQWHNDATGVHMILMRGAPEVSHSQVLYYYGSGAPTCPSSGNNARVWNLDPNDDFADATG